MSNKELIAYKLIVKEQKKKIKLLGVDNNKLINNLKSVKGRLRLCESAFEIKWDHEREVNQLTVLNHRLQKLIEIRDNDLTDLYNTLMVKMEKAINNNPQIEKLDSSK